MLKLFSCIIISANLLFSPLFSQQVLTPRQIFDFNIGDAFHYHSGGYFNYSYQGGFSLQILGKLVSLGNDSVTYYMKNKSYVQNVNQSGGQIIDTIYSESIDTVIYTNLDKGIDSLPEYNIASFIYYQNTYNNYLSFDSLCITFLDFSDTTYNWNLGSSATEAYFADINDNCNTFKNYYHAFGKGIGEIHCGQSVSGGPYYGYHYNLIYFKKDTLSAGTPDALLATEDLSNGYQLSIHPNPATNTINLGNNASIIGSKLSILDNSGRILHQCKVQQTNQQINIEKLMSGTYFLVVEGSEKLTSNFIKN